MATAVKRPPQQVKELPRERQQFSFLIKTDPGLFVKKGSTIYEQIECVGFQPELNLLEAVVEIYQSIGYSGDICEDGSLEFVRFYADFNNDGTWTDLGFSTIRVHNIPGPKPICYTAKLSITPPVKQCGENNLIKIRAILSWNLLPPPNTPGYAPVWGNVVDVTVQTKPTRRLILGPIFSEIAKLPGGASAIAKLPATGVIEAEPKFLSLDERAEVYKDKRVPAQRFAFEEIVQLSGKTLTGKRAPITFAEPVAKLFKPGELLAAVNGLVNPPGNTTFEQLTCVGMRPEDDSVGGVVTVKLPNGYLGTLCDAGSLEYVAFWLELSGTWHYLGTAAVRVHDLETVPPGGVQYAVSIPVNVTEFLQHCKAGPVVGKLRGVLGWNTPPSTTDPNAVPFWGNREECLVQLRPSASGGRLVPRILDISDIPADEASIDQTTGLNTIHDGAPFGGLVAIRADLANFPPFERQYKVEVMKAGGSWQTLMNPIQVRVMRRDALGNIIDCNPATVVFNVVCVETITPTSGPDPGWYPYLNARIGGIQTELYDRTVGYWQTGLLDEGLWTIKVTFRDGPLAPQIEAETIKIRIDNSAPSLHVELDEHNPDDPICGKFGSGDTVTGTFSAHDPSANLTLPNPAHTSFQHFSAISASVLPSGNAVQLTSTSPALPAATSTLVPPNTGADGTWSLNTTTPTVMRPCGYVVLFTASDKTRVGYLAGGAIFQVTHYSAQRSVGFCLG